MRQSDALDEDDMHDAGALGSAWHSIVAEWDPASLALTCLAMPRVQWQRSEASFLGYVAGVRPSWRSLSGRQRGWFEALVSRALL